MLDKKKNSDPNLVEVFDHAEIISIFEELRKEGYILPVVNQYGHGCFILNECKENEWLEKIADLNPTPERIAGKYVKNRITEFFSALGAGMIGGAVTILLSKLAEYLF